MRWKYLLLLPLILLVFNALYYQHVIHKINETLLNEKYITTIEAVDMLSAAIETTEQTCKESIINAVEYLDGLYQVYAAAYDGKLVLITSRHFETSVFEPTDYPEFMEQIKVQKRGNIVIGYTPEDQEYRYLHLYYRWIREYLVIAGVSKYSIVTGIPLLISIGAWANTLITFLLNLGLILIFLRFKNQWS